jgi:hypothetical protein
MQFHERQARCPHKTKSQIATIVAGERPTDLTREEAEAYDLGRAEPWNVSSRRNFWEAGLDAFGERGLSSPGLSVWRSQSDPKNASARFPVDHSSVGQLVSVLAPPSRRAL